MEQKKNKIAWLKGLAFPIGYFLFMNIFQSVVLVAYTLFCILRDVVVPVASRADSVDGFFEILSGSAETLLDRYLTTTLITEISSGNAVWTISALTSVLALIVLWLVFNRKKHSFTEYFHFKPTSPGYIVCAALLGLGFYFVVNAILTLAGVAIEAAFYALLDLLRNSGVQDLAQLLEEVYRASQEAAAMPQSWGWFVLAAVLFAPLVEEIVFRAGAITNLKKNLPTWACVLISSALFSFAHVGSLNLPQLIYTMLLGVMIAFLFIKSDSIYPAIVCHFCFNGANILLLTLGKLLSVEYVTNNPYNNTLYYNGPTHSVSPDPEKLMTWYNSIAMIFTIVSALIGVLMLIVGIVLLIKLRRYTPQAPAKIETTDLPEGSAEEGMQTQAAAADDDLWGNYTFTDSETT